MDAIVVSVALMNFSIKKSKWASHTSETVSEPQHIPFEVGRESTPILDLVAAYCYPLKSLKRPPPLIFLQRRLKRVSLSMIMVS